MYFAFVFHVLADGKVDYRFRNKRSTTASLSFLSLIDDNNSSLRVSLFVQTFKFACPSNAIVSIHKACSTLKDTAQF